jgi:hypothetical protein
MEGINVQFEAFVEFSDLDIDDYIIDLDWDIQAKQFPLSRHTAGDLRSIQNIQKSLVKQKVFKALGELKIEKITSANIPALDNAGNVTSAFSQTQSESERDTIIAATERITEVISDKIVNEVVNNNSFSEIIDVKVEESVTNISDVLNQKIEQSNSFTAEQITELEMNMSMINHTHVHPRELKIIEERVIEQNEKIKQEMDQKIEQQKDFFTKFLNS